MTTPPKNKLLYVVVCGAWPAADVGRLVELAHLRGWQIQVIATDAALEHFIDVPELEAATGNPVLSRYPPGGPAAVRDWSLRARGFSSISGADPSGPGDRGPGNRGPEGSSPRATGTDGGLPDPDAVIVAPATYNTINKWAQGISDTFPLGVLAEVTGLGVPIVVLPFVNSAWAANRVFARSVGELRAAGVRVLLGPGGFEPHPRGTGVSRTAAYPWWLPLDVLDGDRDPA